MAELAPLVDWRDELTWLGRVPARSDLIPRRFWSGPRSAPWLTGQRALLWAARLSPVLLLTLLAAYLAGLLAWPLFLGPLVLNLWLSQRLVGPAVATIRQVGALSDRLGGYAAALALVADLPLPAPALQALQGRLSCDGLVAAVAIRRLQRLAALAQPTSSQLYPLIELATLWNVQVLNAPRGLAAAGRSAGSRLARRPGRGRGAGGAGGAAPGPTRPGRSRRSTRRPIGSAPRAGSPAAGGWRAVPNDLRSARRAASCW